MSTLEEEIEAAKSLLELMQKAESAVEIYQRYCIALPEPLRRILGVSDAGEQKGKR